MENYFTLNMGDGDHAPRNPTTLQFTTSTGTGLNPIDSSVALSGSK